MKKMRIYIALVALLVCGCSQDKKGEEVTKGTTVPLSLSATQTGIVTKATPVLPSGVSTGVYVTAKDATITAAFFANSNYTAGASGILTTIGNVDLTVGSNYDIYSYAPWQATVGNPCAIEFMHGTDVLWAPKTTLIGVTLTNHTATLAFEHRAAQVSFHVVFASDFSSGSTVITSASTLQVNGFYTKGTLDIIAGQLTPSGATSATLSGTGTGPAGAMTLGIGETCIIPSTGNLTLSVVITHEGKTYNGTITDTFLPGSSYNYTVTVCGPAALGITGTLKEWTPVSENIVVQ